MRIAITNISNLGNTIARGIVAGFSAKLIVRNDSTLSGFSERQSARVADSVSRLGMHQHALAHLTEAWRQLAMWLGLPAVSSAIVAAPITTPATAHGYHGLCYAAAKQGQTKRPAILKSRKRRVAAG